MAAQNTDAVEIAEAALAAASDPAARVRLRVELACAACVDEQTVGLALRCLHAEEPTADEVGEAMLLVMRTMFDVNAGNCAQAEECWASPGPSPS